MKYFVLIWLISKTAFAVTINSSDPKTPIRPFGYIAPRPPTTGLAVNFQDELKVTANQVCGYTDWTSAVVDLPKKLLSLGYWKNFGEKVLKDARDTALAVTGAIPSMLVCNASPTFCSIVNKAEAMAQANLKFTVDACEVLESLNDFTKSQFNLHSDCVKKEVEAGKTPSVAIDLCIRNDKDERKNHPHNHAKKTIYDPKTLNNKICQLKERVGSTSSGKGYTVSETICQWSKSFGGIKIEAGAKVRVAGTFQKISPAEKKYEEGLEKTSHFIIELVDLMHQIRFGRGQHEGDGPQPRQSVVHHPKVLKLIRMNLDGSIPQSQVKSESDNHLPPIYRVSSSNSPALMVSPATLYELVDAIPPNQEPIKMYEMGSMSQIALALEPLIQSIAFAHAQDFSQKALDAHHEVCSDPDLQSAGGQEDCQYRIEKINRSMKSLEKRYDADQKHLSAQALYYAEVQKIRQSRITIHERPESAMKDEMHSPQELLR